MNIEPTKVPTKSGQAAPVPKGVSSRPDYATEQDIILRDGDTWGKDLQLGAPRRMR